MHFSNWPIHQVFSINFFISIYSNTSVFIINTNTYTYNDKEMSKPKPSLATKSEEVTSKLTSSPSTTQRELLSLTNLLHLINHHNKNQHRLSKWYKSLCTFRRQVAKLLVEVRELDTALAFSVVNKTQDGKKLGAERKGKEGKYVRLAREKVEERVRFWGQFCEERWFV